LVQNERNPKTFKIIRLNKKINNKNSRKQIICGTKKHAAASKVPKIFLQFVAFCSSLPDSSANVREICLLNAEKQKGLWDDFEKH
jgi:hypothetical protein